MAERPPPTKKVKRLAPAVKCTPEERVKQFPNDLYSDSGVLFCKFCDHSVDHVRVDTIKDHLKSKKHKQRKDLKEAGGSTGAQQVTLKSLKSRDLREEFVVDFIKMASMADIPLEKVEKMKPFLVKYCKQAGTLPQASTLRSTYVPRAFQDHFAALKSLLQQSHPAMVHLTADETTDARDQSILNVLATVKQESYLIGVVRMEACNHSTLSQGILKSVADMELPFDRIHAVITDSAAYCKKAYRDVLSAVFPHSIQVLCLAHIVNLASDVFHKYSDFGHLATLITMVKSSFYKKPGRKARFIAFLKDTIAAADVRLPPVPVSTRWNSWFETAVYHASRVHTYEGFYKAEKSEVLYFLRNLMCVVCVYPFCSKL